MPAIRRRHCVMNQSATSLAAGFAPASQADSRGGGGRAANPRQCDGVCTLNISREQCPHLDPPSSHLATVAGSPGPRLHRIAHFVPRRRWSVQLGCSFGMRRYHREQRAK
jgi:hypothetical protein